MDKLMPSRNATVSINIDGTQLIWFKNSGSFVLMEEPAYNVLQLQQENKTLSEIVEYCSEKYGHLEADIAGFVHEITEYIKQLNTNSLKDFSNNEKEMPGCNQATCEEVYYKFGEKVISIIYSNVYLKEQIHYLFQHLEISQGHSDYRIELSENDERLYFQDMEQKITSFHSNEIEYFKGAILKYLCALIHDKNPDKWMMTIHASGIIKNNDAVLFVASEGSGKSTVSALLQTFGYTNLSDDLVVADSNAKVYPFPAGISVKKGAFNIIAQYYPEVLNQKVNKNHVKPARFIPNHNCDGEVGKGYEIKAVVFVDYNPNEEQEFRLLDTKSSIPRFLKETWINPDEKNISNFFNWISGADFYEMRYFDIKQVEKNISGIFEG